MVNKLDGKDVEYILEERFWGFICGIMQILTHWKKNI